MTSRSKNAVRIYETEIEKSREESNWKKAVELAQQLKARSPQHESLAHFLIGEGKLEAHLDEWPPLKENIERAQRELSEARGYLTLATDEAGIKAGVALDAHLLLGKLNYACGSYDEALKHYKQAELNTLTEKELPVRSLRIVAESYAIKGLCLEQNAVPSSTSRYKQAERENETLRSFELSSELTLLYLQRVGAGGRAGPTLETALYRVPIAHIRAQRLHSALDRYRSMLSAVEAPGTAALRLTLARQLAEVLMRGVTGQVYRPPAAAAAPRRREDPAPEGPWKPKKYTAINQFVPRTSYEEVVLVLLVGEAMAVRDAVLSQSAEFEAARAHSLANAVAVIDLLAVVATRWGQLCLVLESLERAMKFSFGSRHVWRQRALATAAAAPAQHHHEHVKPGTAQWSTGVRALGVLRHAAPLAPADAPLRLVGANTCYRCGWIEEGIELAEAALAIEEESEGFMLARCHLFTGLGYQMKAQKTNSRIDKDAANDVALKHLLKSVQLDDNDHLAFYYLALQHMHLGMLNEAMEATRACLAARSSCAGGLRVCAALWSCACAGPRAERALRAAALARAHYPRAAWPLAALAALQAARGAAEAALATGKELLSLLNSTELEAETEYNGYVELDALSDSQHDDTHSTRDAASIRAESAGAYRLELALSEGASSLSAARPLAAPRAQAWLLLAAACLRYRRLPQARPSERGGGVRFGSGGSDALQPPGALYARHGARGRPGVGGSARVLPERARHPPDAPRQPGAAGRRLLRARLAGAGGAQPARRRGAGARARRRLAPPGAGAGRARGRRRRRRRRGRRPAPAALAARRRAAAVSPAPASCRHPPPCTCSPRSPPPRCRCEPGARLLPTPAS